MKKLISAIIILLCLGTMMAESLKSPAKAALYSAFAPGGGQFYNRAYLKAGVVIGVQSYLVAKAIYHDNKADDYAQLAANTTDEYYQELYRTQRKQYQEMRTSDFWWMGITLTLSVLDAYVDAHLYDFDAEKEKINIRFGDEKIILQYRF